MGFSLWKFSVYKLKKDLEEIQMIGNKVYFSLSKSFNYLLHRCQSSKQLHLSVQLKVKRLLACFR